MNKSKKILLILIGSVIIIIAGIILFISPLTKYLIQKYDEKYTGRQITMSWVYVNPFTGYIHFSNLKIYEYQSDTVFISTNGLSANFNVLKLFSRTVKLSNIKFDQPYGRIIKKEKGFNFDDLKMITSTREGAPRKTGKPFHFYLLNIKIEGGHFCYVDEAVPAHFAIKDADIESEDGWQWDKDTISANFSFLSETGTGGMKGTYGMNLKSLFYELDIAVNNFDLNIVEQYMKQISNYGKFRATFDANVMTNGCFRDAQDINISGDLAINDFHFGKDSTKDYASFDKIVFKMDAVNPKNQKYFIDSVLLYHPYFIYERYDYDLDNYQTMFGKSGNNVTMATSDVAQFNIIFIIGEWVKKLGKNFFRSDFKINRLAIYNGDVVFNDYSLSEKFALELDPLNLTGDSLDKNRNRVNLSLESRFKPYGDLSVALSINPKDTGDFDLQYKIAKIPISIFNPYTITYTSFPLDKGTMNINGNWRVRNGDIQSVNHLVIIDPRTAKRLINDDDKWIPLPLIMAFIRERGNVIDYQIPITGNFNNPKFHLSDVIFDLITNIFVSPVSIPYTVTVKNAANEIEKSLTIKWNMRQSSLLPGQKKFLEKMATFLVKNPSESITVHPETYNKKEKEYILFFEAKKAYYLLTNHLNARSFNVEDSEKVDKMSVKDSVFMKYVNKRVNDTMLFTIQEKCAAIVDPSVVNANFAALLKARESAFLAYFDERGVGKQVKTSASENVIPYNGFSFFKIDYQGEFPRSLIKAYEKMYDLNEKAPRKKFEKEHTKNGSRL